MAVAPLRLSRAGRNDIHVSFEFFPPKTAEMEAALWEAITRLAPLSPRFVSVTYGAGGSTRERTHATVARIIAETQLTPAAHLTCVAATRERGRRRGARLLGRRRPPYRGPARRSAGRAGHDVLAPIPAAMRPRPRSSPASAASATSKYPSRPIRKNIPRARRSTPISMSWRPRSRPARRGRSPSSFSRTSIICVMSIACASAASRSRSCPASPRCRTSSRRRISPKRPAHIVPNWLAERFAGLDDDASTRRLIAAAVAAEQVLDLVDHGVEDFHFYTMNRADLVYAICHLLGLRPRSAASSRAMQDEAVGGADRMQASGIRE